MSKQLTDAKRRAIAKYDAANTKQYALKLNKKTDAKLIAWLDEQEKVQTYLKKLIIKDMAQI